MMQSFYNKEILIGFPFWPWLVRRSMNSLETGEGVGGIINILTRTQCLSALIRMRLPGPDDTRSWCDNLGAIVVASITIITITFHIVSSSLKVNPRNIVSSNKHWMLTHNEWFWLFSVHSLREDGMMGWMGHRGPLGAYPAIITRVLIGTKHYLFVRLLIKSRNKLREWD